VSDFEQRRTAFGEHLRRLREDTCETAKVFAERLGWNAPKVSKVENGRQTVSDQDLERWLTALGIGGTRADELRQELAEVREQRATWKQQLRGGYRNRQQQSIKLEADAATIRGIEYGIVPGLLQTPDYAHHVLHAAAALHGGGHDLPEAVRARMRRQQVLYEPGKTIELLVAEAALWHPIAPDETMTGQIHRLIATIGTPNVRFGILPLRHRLPYPPGESFWILDQVVLIETLGDERRIIDPEQVELYRQVADRLWKVACEGEQARSLLLRLAEAYATD
jgi:transcriptional regulator with XRE-family HTH domain